MISGVGTLQEVFFSLFTPYVFQTSFRYLAQKNQLSLNIDIYYYKHKSCNISKRMCVNSLLLKCLCPKEKKKKENQVVY